jgi:hypothetical protein
MAEKKQQQSVSEKPSGAQSPTLKAKQVVIGLVVLLALVGAISSCGGSKKSSSSDSSSPAVAADTTQDDPASFFDANRSQSLAQCQNYFSLVNQGWTTDEIIGELKNAGSFDNMPGGEAMFHELVKWCYANAS